MQIGNKESETALWSARGAESVQEKIIRKHQDRKAVCEALKSECWVELGERGYQVQKCRERGGGFSRNAQLVAGGRRTPFRHASQ